MGTMCQANYDSKKIGIGGVIKRERERESMQQKFFAFQLNDRSTTGFLNVRVWTREEKQNERASRLRGVKRIFLLVFFLGPRNAVLHDWFSSLLALISSCCVKEYPVVAECTAKVSNQ